MIRAIAIDDEPAALDVVETLCKAVDYIELVHTFTKVNEALAYLQLHPIHLVFLDIQMPAMNGIRLSKAALNDIMVIFTTAYSKYAVESYEVNAIDYLMKPISLKRFLKATAKAHDIYQLQHGTTTDRVKELYVRANASLVKIEFADITHIEGLADYLKIHLSNQKFVITRMTMKEMQEKLPEGAFIRVHRSFIVSKSKISAIKSRTILLGELPIPIGVTYTQEIKNLFNV